MSPRGSAAVLATAGFEREQKSLPSPGSRGTVPSAASPLLEILPVFLRRRSLHPGRPRVAWLGPGFLLTLFLGACAEPQPEGRLHGDSPLVGVLREAAREFDVAVEVLAAVGYVESRWRMRAGEASALGGWGIMHLREGATLDDAVRLTALAPADLRADPTANIRGAAAVLAALERETGDLAAALARYGPGDLDERAGRDYAARVLRTLEDGASGADDAGRAIVLDPGESDGTGSAILAGGPNYPGASWVGPACDYTPASRGASSINFIVIHTCQGGFSGCWSWLLGCGGATASAHYVVSSDGDIVQLVHDDDIAWHADCLNSSSIGIEHEGWAEEPDVWYTDEMYCASAGLTSWLADAYDIPKTRDYIIGHVEVDCSDHWDPGPGWNWDLYMDYVNCGCGGCCPPEACNGVDDDCDGLVDEGFDVDGDGWTTCNGDCNDGDAAVRPGAPEVCNCVDDDCEGGVDEGNACPFLARALEASYPRAMVEGERAHAWVSFVNQGVAAWEPAEMVLAVVEGEGLALGDPGAWAAYDAPARLDARVEPGAIGRFAFDLRAPEVEVERRVSLVLWPRRGADLVRAPCGQEPGLSLDVVVLPDAGEDLAPEPAPDQAGEATVAPEDGGTIGGGCSIAIGANGAIGRRP